MEYPLRGDKILAKIANKVKNYENNSAARHHIYIEITKISSILC